MKQGWEIKKLGDVCEFENGDRGVNYPSKAHRTEIGIPFINAGHLTSGGLDMDSMDYISRERFNLLGSGKVQKSDILFCLRGSLGKFARVQDFSEGAIASSLVIVRPKSIVISDFLMIYFESKICADMIAHFSDVLEYVAYNITPITREERVAKAQKKIFTPLNYRQKEFLEFVLSKYIESGVEELAQEKLPDLLRLKYRALADAQDELGSLEEIKNTFIHFQRHLYQTHSQWL